MSKPAVVVGAGIAGLTAAFELKRAGVDVIVLESGERVGGKIRTSTVHGIDIDEGADSFLARVPEGIELADALGLSDQLISPATSNACIWKNSALRPIPQPNFLGIPLEPAELEPSPLLSANGIAPLLADLERTEVDPVQPNETLGSFIRRRLGDEVFTSLVNPLIGSINAGDCDHLSTLAVAPQIATAATQQPSLIQGLRDQRAKSDPTAPVFYGFPNGMQTLLNALRDDLGDRIRLNQPVTGLEMTRKGLAVATASETINAEACILAIPAPPASRLVHQWADASATLRGIEYVSVVMVTLVYDNDAMPALRKDMSGFLVPVDGNTLISACSFASQKWPNLRDGNHVVLRVSLGRYGADAIVTGTDDDIMSAVRQDLRTTMGIEVPPLDRRITRWPKSFPQYQPGHAAQVAKVRSVLNPDGVFVAGAAYDGLGVPSCIRQGQMRAQTVATFLQHR